MRFDANLETEAESAAYRAIFKGWHIQKLSKMRTWFYLLLVFVIFGSSSAGPRQRFKRRMGRPGRKGNAFKKGSSQQGGRGILKRLDTMDDQFAGLGVQIAHLLENKKDINSQLSEIKTDIVERYEKMESGLASAFSTMNDKLDVMNQKIFSLMDNMLKSLRYMNDTMQNMQRDIKSNIAQGLGNRGKVA